ncbi:hypothetical protein EV182_003401, partial [Spiromyces aspiralis]
SDANDSAVDKPSSPAPASRQQSNGTSGGKAAETAASAKGKGKGKGKGKKGTTSKAAVTKTIKSKGETESKKPEFERDLKGDTYIKCRNPLKEASRLINRLNPAMDTDVRVLSAAFSIYIRQGDLAGAFGAWKHIKELDISHYLVPIYSAVLAAANGQQAIDGLLKPNKLSPEQTAQLEQATASVESACARIEAVITSDGGKSSLALEAAAKAFLLLLHPEGGKERALSLIKSTVLGIQSSPYTQVKDMLRVWDLAKRIGADDEFMGQMLCGNTARAMPFDPATVTPEAQPASAAAVPSEQLSAVEVLFSVLISVLQHDDDSSPDDQSASSVPELAESTRIATTQASKRFCSLWDALFNPSEDCNFKDGIEGKY